MFWRKSLIIILFLLIISLPGILNLFMNWIGFELLAEILSDVVAPVAIIALIARGYERVLSLIEWAQSGKSIHRPKAVRIERKSIKPASFEEQRACLMALEEEADRAWFRENEIY